MRVFVTGGSGLLGSSVVNALVGAGHQVTAAVRPTSVREDLDGRDGVTVRVVALDDASGLRDAMEGHEGLCHVAGAAGRFYSARDHYETTNVGLTESVFASARDVGIRRAVYTGTIVIPMGLDNEYARTKARGAEAARRIAGDAMDVVVVHPSGMIGPRDRTPTPLGRAIAEYAAGRIRVVVGGGSGLIHVDDAGEAHAAALENGDPTREYLLDHAYLTMPQMFAELAEITGRAPPRVIPVGLASLGARVVEPIGRLAGFVPPVNTFVTTYLSLPRSPEGEGDADRRALGLPPHRSIRVALEDALAWFAAHRQSTAA